MEFFDFENFESKVESGHPSATAADHSHSGLPDLQLPNEHTTYSPWLQDMQPGTHIPLNEPFDVFQWNDSLADTTGTLYPETDSPLMTSYDALNTPNQVQPHTGSPTFHTDGNHVDLRSGGLELSDPDQNAYAAIDANNQEIRNWFSQSGRRDSRSRKGLPRRRSLYSKNSGISIPIQKQLNPDWAALDPLERWQNSPPENEAASISAISHAVAATDLGRHSAANSGCSSTVSTPGLESQGFNLAPKRTSRPASISSLESGTSNGSHDSIASSRSRGSRISGGSSNPKNVRSNARVTKSKNRAAPSSDERPFQCTFCCDAFKNKYDWTRHEKSLHLNPEQWVCTPDGGIVKCPTTQNPLCPYCLSEDTTKEHLEGHNMNVCAQKSIDSRSFKRKDHLIQHLRLVHKVDKIPTVGQWRAPELPVKSRCGFCGYNMEDWKTRADHLGKHFREGVKMVDWRGTHGFEPQIARQVTNSMPPFLIGNESKTLIPFSATKPGHKEHLAQITSRAAPPTNSLVTAGAATDNAPSMSSAPIDRDDQHFKTVWEFLTFHLGRFAQEKIKAGIIPTDEMFQQESRRLWYDSDDPFDQTVADSMEWMEIFRKEHGLNKEKETSAEAGRGEARE